MHQQREKSIKIITYGNRVEHTKWFQIFRLRIHSDKSKKQRKGRIGTNKRCISKKRNKYYTNQFYIRTLRKTNQMFCIECTFIP